MTDMSSLGWVPSGFNYIQNPCFEVNQRGVASVNTNGTYPVDRWRNSVETATNTLSQQAFTVGQTDVPGEPQYYLRSVSVTASNAAEYAGFTQGIEDVRTLAGRTVTLSFWAKADAAKSVAIELEQNYGSGGSTTVFTAVGKPTLSTTWTKYNFTILLPSISGKTIGSSHLLKLNFWITAGSNFNSRTNSLGNQSGTFEFANIKLEEGSIATPFVVPRFEEELRKCRRYYRRLGVGALAYEYIASGGLCASSTIAIFPIYLDIPMRATPTIVAPTAYTNFRLFDGANSITLSANPLITNSSPGVVNLECIVASGLTQYRPVTVTANNQTTDYIGLSAEL